MLWQHSRFWGIPRRARTEGALRATGAMARRRASRGELPVKDGTRQLVGDIQVLGVVFACCRSGSSRGVRDRDPRRICGGSESGDPPILITRWSGIFTLTTARCSNSQRSVPSLKKPNFTALQAMHRALDSDNKMEGNRSVRVSCRVPCDSYQPRERYLLSRDRHQPGPAHSRNSRGILRR